MGFPRSFLLKEGVNMHSIVKDVFIIIGTLMASLLLFYLAFGDPGRNVMWGGAEPVFQEEWNKATSNNGDTMSAIMNKVFDEVEDVSY